MWLPGFGGADPNLFKTLAKKFNFMIKYKLSRAGFEGALDMVGISPLEMIFSSFWYIYFQSSTREVDISLTRELFTSKVYHLNDFLFIMGSYDFAIISVIPDTSLNYATMLKAFDVYTWIFIIISVLSVTATVVAIEKTSAAWLGFSNTASTHQCNRTFDVINILSK